MGSAYGESERRLREIFEQAAENAPSIIFIDEIDSIAPKRGQVTGEAEKRLVAQLLTLLDGIEPRQNTVVIAATNRPEAIDEALRRPGRFDREIVVGVPDEPGRREILGIHTRGMPLAQDVNLDDLARRTYGFVGADIAALTREAALEAVRRIMPRINLSEDVIPAEVLDTLSVDFRDFENALKRVQPSAMREVMVEAPQVRWDDVGGLDAARDRLKEGVELPLKHPEAFRRLGIRPAKGFLLYGPPGTGKTLLAKAAAREAEANFIATKSSDLLSKWYGESEQQIARLFSRARQVAPTIIFIDELDSLVPMRGGGLGEPQVTERVVNTILAEMDGLEELQNVVVIGATNRPTLIDPALLRPGRFDELIYVGTPDTAGRRRILAIHTRRMPLAEDVDLEKIAQRTDRFTGADLEDLVRRAGLTALRRGLESAKVTMEDFETALSETRASVTPEMLEEYARIQDTLKSDATRPLGGIGFVLPGMLHPRAGGKEG
jgi:transitional endoplasmic reticulum ATPase